MMLRPGGQELVQGWVGDARPLLLMVISLDRAVELHMLHWVEILVKDGERLVTSVALSVAMVATLMVFMVVTSMVLYMVFLVFLMISTMVFLLISSMMVLMMNFDWGWNFHKFVLLVDNWLGLNRGTKIGF